MGSELPWKSPVAACGSVGNPRRRNANTGFDSDYLPPEVFVHRSVGSVQDGKLSSSPDSADRIRRFLPVHPVSGFVVRIRRTSPFDRVKESSVSAVGHSPFPPVPDSLSKHCCLSRICPAGNLPVSCTSIFANVPAREVDIPRKFPFRALPRDPAFPKGTGKWETYRGYWGVF